MNSRLRLTKALLVAGNKSYIKEKLDSLKSSLIELQKENPEDEGAREIWRRLEEVENKLI